MSGKGAKVNYTVMQTKVSGVLPTLLFRHDTLVWTNGITKQ